MSNRSFAVNIRCFFCLISFFFLSFFGVLAPSANPEDVLKRANAAIQAKYEFFETTLQIERFQVDMDDCKQCVGPLK